MKKKSKEDLLLVYGVYWQVATFLQHYNRIQVTYRTFASSWLLATFFGIGYALSPKEVNLPFDPLITSSFICLAGAMGIALIWYMDLIVCEQSIAAMVFEGIELEKKHKWLPQFYSNVTEIQSLIGYVSLKLLFYIGAFAILLVTMGATLTLYSYLNLNSIWIMAPISILLIICVVTFLLIYSTRKLDPYRRISTLDKDELG